MGWFSRKRSLGDSVTDRKRPPLEPIEVDSWSRPGNALRTLCITQADWSIHWHLRHRYGISQPDYERRGSRGVDGDNFDVYEAAIPGGRREYWMNVSYWFGRGLLGSPNARNAPPPGDKTTVLELFGDDEFRNLPYRAEFLEQIKESLGRISLQFARYSSQQFFNNVAYVEFQDGQPTLMVTAVRRFLADSLPLLHGFRFVKPFVMHQVIHAMYRQDPAETEVLPKADYVVPRPGSDCILFTPAAQERPATDFWHYMLWSHRVGAFDIEAERNILTASAMTAVASGWLRTPELVEALDSLEVAGSDGAVLGELARSWLPREMKH